jgi:L,D-transpeptidase-like protein/sporulation and spore germination protein/putative peptidoglycan binding protein
VACPREHAGMRLVLALTAAACTASLVLAAPAASAPTARVWFLKEGQLVPAQRRALTIADTVRALLAGPTAPERTRGLRSAIPSGTPLRAVTIERRVVTVDLGGRFAAGRSETSLRARVAQLARTVSSVRGVAGVRVLVEGGVPLGLFPGLDLRRPVRTVALPVDEELSVREAQELLAGLGYLAPELVSGQLDDATADALLELEKWVGLPRDGVLDAETRRALEHATRPRPVTLVPGRHVEILLDRQLALLVDGGRVVRAVHISTGAGGTTPVGSFRVYRKERLSWSIPFEVWMPWASYFTGGIALHEYPIVPTYPASHGCVRVNRYDAPFLYDFAGYGTPVVVLPSSR